MIQSVNSITNKSYPIPKNKDDRKNIDEFLLGNAGKKVVVVQGLGFVGAVMSLVVANAITEEYAVIGIDLPNESAFWKIKSINEGVFPVISSDKKVGEFFNNALDKKNLYATYDPYAYSRADVVIVDINLDVEKTAGEDNSLLEYSVNMDSFRKAIEAIAENGKSDVLILVETTVPPGTCEKVVKPIFDEIFARRGLPGNYYIGHSYERVMPGPHYIDSIQNYFRVYSGIDERSASATEQFLKTIIFTDKYPLTRLHSTTASEMSKVLENSFRAMNIAFIQEWSSFAEEAGVNLFQVLDAIRMRSTHKNIMSPGLGVGGYCLPKDPLLASWSRQNIFKGAAPLSHSEAAVSVNDQMPAHTYQIIKKRLKNRLSGVRIGLLGVSYLNNIGDTRYAPAALLYDLLVKEGAIVQYTDEYVPIWMEKSLSSLSMEQLVSFAPEVLVYCTRHVYFSEDDLLIQYLLESEGLLVVDAVGLLEEERIVQINKKSVVTIVGRGDI